MRSVRILPDCERFCFRELQLLLKVALLLDELRLLALHRRQVLFQVAQLPRHLLLRLLAVLVAHAQLLALLAGLLQLLLEAGDLGIEAAAGRHFQLQLAFQLADFQLQPKQRQKNSKVKYLGGRWVAKLVARLLAAAALRV
jgi:hypothetical protein